MKVVIFSLVQIFVAMNPEDTVYFANPGPDGKFNKDYYFELAISWADLNEVIVLPDPVVCHI